MGILKLVILFLITVDEGARGQQCPDDRVVPGLVCGNVPGNQPCPTGTTCVFGPAMSGGRCCRVNGKVTAKVKVKDSSSTQFETGMRTGKVASINNHCTSPLMHDGYLITCTPEQNARTCPSPCFTCMPLLGTFVGLCCEDRTNAGCGNPYAPQARPPYRVAVSSSYLSATTPQPLYHKPKPLVDEADVDIANANSYTPEKAYVNTQEAEMSTHSEEALGEDLHASDSPDIHGRNAALSNDRLRGNAINNEYMPNTKGTRAVNNQNLPILNDIPLPETMYINDNILTVQKSPKLKARRTSQSSTVSKYANAVPTNVGDISNQLERETGQENTLHANRFQSEVPRVSRPVKHHRYIMSKYSKQNSTRPTQIKSHIGNNIPIESNRKSYGIRPAGSHRNDGIADDDSLDIPNGILPDNNNVVILGVSNSGQTNASVELNKKYARVSMLSRNSHSSYNKVGYRDGNMLVERHPKPQLVKVRKHATTVNEDSSDAEQSYPAPPHTIGTVEPTGKYSLQAEYTNNADHSEVTNMYGSSDGQTNKPTTVSIPVPNQATRRMDVDNKQYMEIKKKLQMKHGYREKGTGVKDMKKHRLGVAKSGVDRHRQHAVAKVTVAPTPALNLVEATARPTDITNVNSSDGKMVKPQYNGSSKLQLERDQTHLQKLSRKSILHIEILPNTRNVRNNIGETNLSQSYRAAQDNGAAASNSRKSAKPSTESRGYEQEEHIHSPDDSSANPFYNADDNSRQVQVIPFVSGYPTIPKNGNGQTVARPNAAIHSSAIPNGTIQENFESSDADYALSNSNNMLRGNELSNNLNSSLQNSLTQVTNSNTTSSNIPLRNNNILFTGPLTVDSIKHSIDLLQQLGIEDISPGYVQGITNPNQSVNSDRTNAHNQTSNNQNGRQNDQSFVQNEQDPIPNSVNGRQQNDATSSSNNHVTGRSGLAIVRGGNPCGGPSPVALCLGPEYTQCGAGYRCVHVTSNIGVCCPSVTDVDGGFPARVTTSEFGPCGPYPPVSQCLGTRNLGCRTGSHCVRMNAEYGVCCSDRRLIGSADVAAPPGVSTIPARASPITMPGSPLSPTNVGSNPCGGDVSPRSMCMGPFNRQCDRLSRCVQVNARFGVCCPVRNGVGMRNAVSFRRLVPGLIPRFTRGNEINLDRARRFMSGGVGSAL